MSISAIAFTKEMLRQGLNKDANFYQKLTYFFELQLPIVAVGGDVLPGVSSSFMFPLILPPEAYTLEEPFAVELTPTQRGGLYAEENGIIQRVIRLKGNTGFKPRPLRTFAAVGKGPPALMAPTPRLMVNQAVEMQSHSRMLPSTIFMEISGQRHFQYLQDSVFRTYADLKRDPATARDTMMFFHNLKDDEHWRVIPLRFVLDRDSKRPTLYNYNIELAVLGKASPTADLDFDDKSILDALNDAFYMCDMAADLAAGCLDDLIGIQGDLKAAGCNVTVLIDGLTDILDAMNAFIDGQSEFINVPYAWTQSLIEFADEAAELGAQDSVPPEATEILRETVEALEMVATNPAAFVPANTGTMTAIKNAQEFNRSVSIEQQRAAASGTTPRSFDELEALGTGLTPGAVKRGQAQISVGGDTKAFRSTKIISISQGDTLATLAAQYLGDARLWQYLAVANGLKPPYVDAQATAPLAKGGADERLFIQALGRGDKILIPSNASAAKDFPVLPVLGVPLEEPIANQILGVDALLEPQSGITGDSTTVYDIPIDTELGSTDIKLTEGFDNIAQVIRTRLIAEQGTDLMYKLVGTKRIIGLNFLLADLANAQFRIQESVEADSRIAAVSNMKLEQKDDALVVNLDASLRGFPESKSVEVTLQE